MPEYLDSIVSTWSWPALVATIVISMALLAKGATVLVEAAVAVSLRWGVRRAVVGATVVSLGTTLPEAVVSVLAAFQGRSEVALGNAVGSIICDTGLILGIACLIAPLPFDRRVADRQGWLQLGFGFLLVAACVPWADPLSAFAGGGNLPQLGGWLLIGLLVLYLGWSVHLAKTSSAEAGLDGGEPLHGPVRTVLNLVVSIAVVVISSSFLISAAAELAVRLNVPPSIIAVTLVAFGTSLPELIIVVTATVNGHGELAIGNIIGADILNVLFVAGAAAAVTPHGLIADSFSFLVHFPAMLFILVVFRIGLWSARDNRLKRPFGIVLLGTYIAVTGISYLISGVGPAH